MALRMDDIAPAQVRCAIYVRKSTEKGLEQEFTSLDAQREACEAYIASQRFDGWVALPDRYDDPGFSGGNMERPGLKRLIADIKSGKVNMVIVHRIDRISRSLLDFAKLMELFEEYNVSFTSITQQINTGTAMGRLLTNVLLSFAAFEREISAERVRDKVAAAKKKGKYMGGTLPYGYDLDRERHKLVVNTEEAKTVRHVFKRFLEVGSGLGIARELNAKGITTKSWVTNKGDLRRGSTWDTQHIYRLLNNRTYLGETVHKDQSYPGEHEAIISKSLWDKVHSILDNPNGRKKNQPARTVPAPMKGVIRCGHCDRAMTGTYTKKGTKTYRYYVCTKASRNGYDVCPVRSVPAGEIEDAVIGQLRAVFRSPEVIAQTFREAQTLESQGLAQIHDDIAELKADISSLRTTLSDLAESDEDYWTISRLIDEKEALSNCKTHELHVLQSNALTENDVIDALTTLDPIWNELFPAEQQRIVGLLVDKVVVNTDGLDIRIRAQGLHSLVAELTDTHGTNSERI